MCLHPTGFGDTICLYAPHTTKDTTRAGFIRLVLGCLPVTTKKDTRAVTDPHIIYVFAKLQIGGLHGARIKEPACSKTVNNQVKEVHVLRLPHTICFLRNYTEIVPTRFVQNCMLLLSPLTTSINI